MNFIEGILTTPKTQVNKTISSIKNKKSNHINVIVNHHFNSKVEIFLDSETLQKLEENLLKITENHFYYYLDTKISTFLNFCKKTHSQNPKLKIISQSIFSNSETSNILSYYNSNLFILIDIDTFQSLGVEGKKFKFDNDKYLIHIDFSKEMNEKNFTKLIQKLDKLSPAKILLSVYDDEQQKSIDIENNFENMKKINLSINIETIKNYNIIEIDKLFEKEYETYLIDYIGCLKNNIQNDDSKYEKLKCIKIEGFISSYFIHSFFQSITSSQFDDKIVSFMVTGFENSIVSWKNEIHFNKISGENDYLFIISNTLDYVLFKFFGECDK
jgi:hypothetical protein